MEHHPGTRFEYRAEAMTEEDATLLRKRLAEKDRLTWIQFQHNMYLGTLLRAFIEYPAWYYLDWSSDDNGELIHYCKLCEAKLRVHEAQPYEELEHKKDCPYILAKELLNNESRTDV